MRTSKIFVTVDAVIFRQHGGVTEILFVQRKNEPFKDKWALPGGFVEENEDLEVAAIRELDEETGVKISQLQQLGAFGKPGRDPRHHTVSVAYTGFAPEGTAANAADDAEDASWFPTNDLPDLAFDHSEIVTRALEKLML